MGTHVRERESHIPSRRQTLRAIGFSGLAAAIPVTVIAGAGELHPDVEIVALGKEFDRLHAAWVPLHKAHWDAWRRCRSILEAADDTGDEAFYSAVRQSRVDETAAAADAAQKPLDALSAKIRDMPAMSLRGLSVKARVVLHEVFCPGSYDGVADDDMNWDALCYVRFMREIAALAGEVRA